MTGAWLFVCTPKSLKARHPRTDVLCMFLPISVVPSVSEASIQALCPSLNTPVLNIEQLPVGPARAAILLFGGDYGDVCLVLGLRSLETSEVVIFNYQADPSHFNSVSSAVGAALSFAEGMGFLFEDDLIAHGGAEGRGQASRVWESLVRATEAEIEELEEAEAPVGAFEDENFAGEAELSLTDVATDEIESAAGDEGGELLLEESISGTEIMAEETDPEIGMEPRLDAAQQPELEAARIAGEQATEQAPEQDHEQEHEQEVRRAADERLGDPDSESFAVAANQTRILTKFRGGDATSSPAVASEVDMSAEAPTAVGRVPLARVPAGREGKPNLLARLLGSF